jgi:hypothetical protein
MITMEMADENMVYFSEAEPVAPELHLCAFATVYQKQTLMCGEHMSGWISF